MIASVGQPGGPTSAGWLARLLIAAEHNLRDVERQVEGFLTSLLPDWQGWAFRRVIGGDVAIDVYMAIDSAAAAAALHRAGFATVTIHDHESRKIITCTCTSHEAP